MLVLVVVLCCSVFNNLLHHIFPFPTLSFHTIRIYRKVEEHQEKEKERMAKFLKDMGIAPGGPKITIRKADT